MANRFNTYQCPNQFLLRNSQLHLHEACVSHHCHLAHLPATPLRPNSLPRLRHPPRQTCMMVTLEKKEHYSSQYREAEQDGL